ncbi:ERBB-3 BINDING PROTEIN 1 [Orobanche minor]
MSDEEMEERELDLTSPEVVTKYKSAAEIVNKGLQLVLSECQSGARIVDLCEKGDDFIRVQTGNMYVKKKIERGVAFPTCISVNNTVCHFSPLASDDTRLRSGDILKIDMGCHIDGFIAVVAHTHALQQGPITGRAADVIAAANTAAEVALRLVRPGKKATLPRVNYFENSRLAVMLLSKVVGLNKDVTEAIQKVAAAYDCKIVEGVLSHQMKQFVIDGNKVVLSVPGPETKVDEAEFEENEVYSIDIVTSTGEGKPKLLDEKQTTVYKRAVDKNYHLKMKASRFIFSEISQKFPIMPFSVRALEDKRVRFGLVECMNHDLLQPYPVLHEKPGELVAHIKFTVLLMPNGSDRITCHPLQQLLPTKTIDDPEIKAWLALGTKTKKKGGGKKKKGKKADKSEGAADAEPMDVSASQE